MDLKSIPFGTNESFNVLIEISKGSPNKYEYDEESQEIKLEFAFTDGFTFLYNYGLIPETKAPDGDHLDAIVLSNESLKRGTVVTCRAIGMIELIDNGEEDNKIIAVPVADESYKDIQGMEDLPDSWCDESRKFFQGIAIQKNKIMEVKSFQGRKRALEELDKSKI